ncbi:MAG: EamA family transporter, partial [Caulobacterales bacterium]|nr:EamA family transporter [Caulobacterales bacterium]
MLGAAAIGAAPFLVRMAEAGGVGPTAAGFWRLALALPLLLAWTARAGRTAPDVTGDRRRLWGLAALAGFFFAGDLATWHAGILLTTSANAALLPNLTPVVITLIAWLFLRERIRAG